MPVTVLGILTLVRVEEPENACSPISVTIKPLMVSGMVTEPPGPVYRVMVIVVPFVA